MTGTSLSTFGWLDSSERERRAVLELVSALNEPGTLDELGIGSIRDTIADTLFPGTSTIQTRARYFLFVPWILQQVERSSTRRHEERARSLQLQLCNALDEAHGPNQGVIGREARAALQRWPLSLYWLGLARWGIRRYPGSIRSYFAALRQPSSGLPVIQALEEQVEGRRDEAMDPVRGNWAVIPDQPPGFPEAASFELTAEEAHFLRERVVLTHPQSYLAHILQASAAGETRDAEAPWDHPSAGSASHAVQAWLHDARLFSLVQQGAALLYNFMLAEALEDEEGSGEVSAELASWSQTKADAQSELESWDRAAMWERLHRANPRLHRRTRDFADHWYEVTVACGQSSLADRADARTLVRGRERELKGARARLTYKEARDRRQGYPTSAPLRFRWPQARQITADVLDGLGAAGA